MASIRDFKLDERNKKEFVKDMQRGLKSEVKAIREFEKIVRNSDVENPEIVYCGSEQEGEILYNDKNEIANVDLFPDYLMKYKENRRIRFNFIEVKICNPYSDYAYFKLKQLYQYEELSHVLILFVMAFDTSSPKFILVEPRQILGMDIEPEEVYGKKTIKAPTNKFNWLSFSEDVQCDNLLNRKYIK